MNTTINILVVDDDTEDIQFLQQALDVAKYPCTLISFFNAEDAFAHMDQMLHQAELLPDVILMDLSIPVMDGIAATTSIRANEKMREIPIIALTAHQEVDLRSEAKASGFDAYVTKPIDVDFLDELIKGLLP